MWHLGAILHLPERFGTDLLEELLQGPATIAGAGIIAINAGTLPACHRHGPRAGMCLGNDQALERTARVHAVTPRQRVYELPRMISA